MVRTKRYVASDGCYLTVDERAEGIYIAWYLPEEDDVGGYIGEGPEAQEPASDDIEAWENWVVYETVKTHADGKDGRAFYFETVRKAKIALAACNVALATKSRPWPSWAIQAKEAGWTPPEGWKP